MHAFCDYAGDMQADIQDTITAEPMQPAHQAADHMDDNVQSVKTPADDASPAACVQKKSSIESCMQPSSPQEQPEVEQPQSPGPHQGQQQLQFSTDSAAYEKTGHEEQSHAHACTDDGQDFQDDFQRTAAQHEDTEMQCIQALEEAHNIPTDVTPIAKQPGKSGKQVMDLNQLQAVDEEMPDVADNSLHPDGATEPGSSSAVPHATASSVPTEHTVSTEEPNEPLQRLEGGAGMESSCMPADSMPMQTEPQHQTEEEMPSNLTKSANHWQTGKAAADSPVEVHGPPANNIVHMDVEGDHCALQQEYNDAEMTSDKATCEPIVEVTHLPWHL